MARLSKIFLANVDAAWAARLERLTGLDETLAALVHRGRSAWPGIVVSPEDFLGQLADGLPVMEDPVEAPTAVLDAIHAEDLYLACACARGDVGALQEFEKAFMSRVVKEIAHRKISPDLDDESVQRLRVRLFVAEGGERPRISSYQGRAPLAQWLFVAAARTAINLRHSDGRHDRVAEILREMPGDPDPEMEYLKLRYGKELELALREALAKLSPRDTAILRLTFQDGMTGDDLARMYKVSRRTIVYQLKEIRARILHDTRAVLLERLHLSASELDSLVGMVVSRIGVSLDGKVAKPGK